MPDPFRQSFHHTVPVCYRIRLFGLLFHQTGYPGYSQTIILPSQFITTLICSYSHSSLSLFTRILLIFYSDRLSGDHMKFMKIMAAVLLLLCAAVLFSGCIGNDGSDAGNSTSSGNTSGGPANFSIGYQPSTHQAAYMVADSFGWWASNLSKYGVSNVSENLFPSGPSEMTALSSDSIQAAYVGSAPVVTAIASGADVKIVAAVQTDGSAIVVRNNLTYNSPQDLKGTTIATFPPGSIQDTLLREWLRNNNLKPDVDVVIKGMSQGDAITALKSGAVDAVFLPHPSPVTVVEEGIGRVVINSGEMNPDHPCCVLAVNGKLIREHPEVVKELVRIHIDATDYVNKNVNESAKIYAKKTGDTESVSVKSMNEWDGSWITDPHVISEAVVAYSDSQYESNLITKKLTEDQIFDFTFYDEVMNEKGSMK